MTATPQHTGRRRSIIAAAASVVLALLGAVVLFMATRTSDGPPQPPSGAGQSLSASASPTQAPLAPAKAGRTTASPPATANRSEDTSLGPVLTPSPPAAINIPSIGIRTSNFVDLGLGADGSLQVPTDFASIGWYTAGPSPGELGPAILGGHVDSHNGPAVFFRLGALRPGARVTIGRKDGSTATFSIDRVQRFPKNNFPTALVYGSTKRAELRLITCGGSFDQKSGHYVDNVVAFAHLVT
ncbi:MAG: class F sortase [Dermatophilaceae bacterium]|nr:class F sortase [Dermatophilaceae bacterium]